MVQDPYKYFRIEAAEIVEHLSRGVGELESGAGTGTVAHLLRLAHTLKGAAHVVKHAMIARLAHDFEEILMPFADAQSVPESKRSELLRVGDAIAGELSGIATDRPKQEAAKPAVAAAEETLDTVRVGVADLDTLLQGVAEAVVQINALKARVTTLKQSVTSAARLSEHLRPIAGNGGNALTPATMVKARTLAEQMHANLEPTYTALAIGVEHAERELEQIRSLAAELRLVPANAIFSTLERAARNTAEALGKKVEFETAGGENSLDAHVLSVLRDAMLHLVRNAVAHGIESPDDRIAAGKTASGKVRVRVARHGNRVAVACTDDGRGFDVDALRRAAIERKIISSAETETLAGEEIVRVILRGGISTAGTISEMAGRGIGLDVVRQSAAHLNADINVISEPGAGSTIELTVPVSLLSLDAVLVEAGGMAASLPIDAVQETIRLQPQEIVRNSDNDSIIYQNRAIPYLSLSAALRQNTDAQRARTGAASAVVIKSSGDLAAVGVDRLVGTATVLLRPIPAFAGVDRVVAGASLDEEGNPQIVLDPAGLVSAARLGRAMHVRTVLPKPPAVLVIDDSLTTRMLEQSILESAGYEVDTANSGEEALQKARTRRYNLFLVDIEMPGMDGFDFIERTRADAALSAIPSILVTSRTSNEDRRRGIEVGARGYIVKGEFDQGALLNTIRGLVG